jgi:hypothetical protein
LGSRKKFMLERKRKMIETPTDARTRDAYRAAHEARAEAVKDFISWITKGSRSG